LSLNLISLTGADDQVCVKSLAAITQRFPNVEWAILYFPEREGMARNPSAAWREQFISEGLTFTAAHLCGVQVFRELLDETLAPKRITDLSRYRRIQININARQKDFTETEVHSIYRTLHEAGFHLILQYHEGSKMVIDNWMLQLNENSLTRVDILFDGSKGKGVSPDAWPVPIQRGSFTHFCGYAGGLGPDAVQAQLPVIQAVVQTQKNVSYWIDMETGIRTDNEFDLAKVEQVLAFCALQS